MPRKEWTDEEVQAEIAAAVQIVKEDREKAQYASLHERFGKKEGEPDPPGTPPKKEGEPEPEKKSGKSIYWGQGSDEE